MSPGSEIAESRSPNQIPCLPARLSARAALGPCSGGDQMRGGMSRRSPDPRLDALSASAQLHPRVASRGSILSSRDPDHRTQGVNDDVDRPAGVAHIRLFLRALSPSRAPYRSVAPGTPTTDRPHRTCPGVRARGPPGSGTPGCWVPLAPYSCTRERVRRWWTTQATTRRPLERASAC
jgi:hypothetical protein